MTAPTGTSVWTTGARTRTARSHTTSVAAPAKMRGREEHAQVGADEAAHGLRHDEADEADGTGDADDRADDRGAGEEGAALERADVDAEARRGLVAERQHVDARRVRDQHAHADERVESHEAELRP